MDHLEFVEKLAQRAREESVPATDVGDRVAEAIHGGQDYQLAPLWVCAAGTCVTAVIVAVFAQSAFESLASSMTGMIWSGSLHTIMSPLRMIML